MRNEKFVGTFNSYEMSQNMVRKFTKYLYFKLQNNNKQSNKDRQHQLCMITTKFTVLKEILIIWLVNVDKMSLIKKF